MSQHPRNSQSKKKQALPKRCLTRPAGNRVQKKTKKISASPPSPSNNTRPKRLSGLTATTLLQYCTNLLSPKSNERTATKRKTKTRSSPSTSPPTKKARVRSTREENEPPLPPVRTRREASSRASALILQQNEIERSRFNFPLAQESNSRRLRRSKSPVPLLIQPEPFQFHIPAPPPPPPPAAPPSITNIPMTKSISSIHSTHPPLTEALLAEHDRRLGTIPSYHLSKRENLLKWTQELGAFDHFSPPSPTWDDKEPTATPFHRSLSFSFEQSHRPLTNPPYPPGGPTFLAPSASASSNYPLGFSSFYSHSLLPCWQYPGKPQK